MRTVRPSPTTVSCRRPHRGLMRGQAAKGERGLALRLYEGLVRLLEHELGSSPAPETSALCEELRQGKPGV
jgi:DNA-binding SARP family transcriptional activator